jgi:hypothetical protein
MFYCTRTTEIFSVRSSAAPVSVERARQRSEKIAALAFGDLTIAEEKPVLRGNRKMDGIAL